MPSVRWNFRDGFDRRFSIVRQWIMHANHHQNNNDFMLPIWQWSNNVLTWGKARKLSTFLIATAAFHKTPVAQTEIAFGSGMRAGRIGCRPMCHLFTLAMIVDIRHRKILHATAFGTRTTQSHSTLARLTVNYRGKIACVLIRGLIAYD